MHDAVRIAAAQLAGLSRKRTVVEAPPFTALLKPGAPEFFSYAVARTPGTAVHELNDSLSVLHAAFAPNPVRFELIDEAAPGAVDALLAAGLTATGRYPLLTLDTAKLIMPTTPVGAIVRVVTSQRDAAAADTVTNLAFGHEPGTQEPDPPGEPAGGGCVLARINGTAVATAFWTAVADEVSEIAGVATLPEYRNRGLGALVTAKAVQAATELAGVTLAWLTPGDDGADRIYRSVGFTPTATAVHLIAK